MVSTRSVRYKFSEGERVLCYEPDPTKAKVLYDSKVLEVIENKDKRGKKSVEYLIHFQGWNSSWDRCVSEDFVLKDTEENRQLQRDLAEKSQLQLGAYLYRKERKKGSSASAGTAKKHRQGFSDDGSSSSTQPDDGEMAADTDTSSGSASSAQRQSPPAAHPVCRAQITIPPSLRDRLTLDYHLVVKRGKMARLPSSPSAADILEAVVKWFGRAGAWNPPKGRHEPPQRPDIVEVSARVNLVREVADGLRVYFDFIFRGHLLYRQERAQYQHVCGQSPHFPTDMNVDEDEENQSPDEDEKDGPHLEDAHLPPDPDDQDDRDDQDDEPSMKLEKAEMTPPGDDYERGDAKVEKSEEDSEPETSPDEEQVELEPEFAEKYVKLEGELKVEKEEEAPEDGGKKNEDLKPGVVTRRLRSHRPEAEGDDAAAAATPASSVGSSASSAGDERAFRPAARAAACPARTPLSLLMEKVAQFELIPRDGSEHLPCRVYGAIHLARLFVKLPVFLNATKMPDMKLKLILKYVDIFVQYLDEHSEWFGESFYVPNTYLNSS